MLPDYYKILEVPVDATNEEIHRSYRMLAKKLHPDVNGSPDAELRIKTLNEAYQVLMHPLKRKKYDLLFTYAVWKDYRKYGTSSTRNPSWEQYNQRTGETPASERRKTPGMSRHSIRMMNNFIFYSVLVIVVAGIVFSVIDAVVNLHFQGLLFSAILVLMLYSVWSMVQIRK
ncbi:MAG: J domain-containing protein [Bacteroidota bacterium]